MTSHERITMALKNITAMQVVLILSFGCLCWLGMQIIHECGHVLAAWVSGGHVSKVVLHPLVISRTDVRYNPHPLFVVWAGPLFGSIFPLLCYLGVAAVKLRIAYLFRFFAGSCFVINGAYIGMGSIQGVADASDMLYYGSARWQLIAFGICAYALGFFLWHKLGPCFGLGNAEGNVNRLDAIASFVMLVLVTGIEVIIGSK